MGHQSWIEDVEGVRVVVAEIAEADAGAKPVRVRATGKAYLRSHDGDFALSQVEEQTFIASRTAPAFDKQVVEQASREDLDPELVASYVEACRASSTSLARFSDEEVLFRTGVTAGADRAPTAAGLLALGIHPQQFLPNLVPRSRRSGEARKTRSENCSPIARATSLSSWS